VYAAPLSINEADVHGDFEKLRLKAPQAFEVVPTPVELFGATPSLKQVSAGEPVFEEQSQLLQSKETSSVLTTLVRAVNAVAHGEPISGAPLLMSATGDSVPLSNLAQSCANSSYKALSEEPTVIPAKKPKKGSAAAVAAQEELKASRAAAAAELNASRAAEAAELKASRAAAAAELKKSRAAAKEAAPKPLPAAPKPLPAAPGGKDKKRRSAVMDDSSDDSSDDSDDGLTLAERASLWGIKKAKQVKAVQGQAVQTASTVAAPELVCRHTRTHTCACDLLARDQHTQDIESQLALAVSELPQAICVTCRWKATDHTTNFVDRGSQGTFCADKAECTARLTATRDRNPKPLEHTTAPAPKLMTCTAGALLRSAPFLTSHLNGVTVEAGDRVTVLDDQTCDQGVSFLQIQTTNRKKGWVRKAYCVAV
jgi:hypothetical protein